MNRDDIIRMAREAGWNGIYSKPIMSIAMQEEDFLRFAALVAAAERERMVADGWRQCAIGQKVTQYCGLAEEAVAAEREACAQLVQELCDKKVPTRIYANTIRARGDA